MISLNSFPKEPGIYLWRNKLNGRCYVGQSVNLYDRIRAHHFDSRRGIKALLYNSIRKYGIENFEVTILQLCTRDQLHEREIHFIKEYNCVDPKGYNLTCGGDVNVMLIPEIRAKSKAATKLAMSRPDVVANLRRVWSDPEVLARRREQVKRVTADPEVRRRMSEGCKRAGVSPELRATRSVAMKARNKIFTPEIREKANAAKRANFKDPVFLAKFKEAMRISQQKRKEKKL